jgi:hypothetical protein
MFWRYPGSGKPVRSVESVEDIPVVVLVDFQVWTVLPCQFWNLDLLSKSRAKAGCFQYYLIGPLTQQKTSPWQGAKHKHRQQQQAGVFRSRSDLVRPGISLSISHSIAARCTRPSDPMHLVRLQRPLQRAAASSSRPLCAVLRTTTATTTALEDRFAHLRITLPTAANAAVEGRRYASVKSQGAYRLKNKKTIPKKMGAKKAGGMSSSIARVGLGVNVGRDSPKTRRANPFPPC